jgi:hypothetical protein
VVELGDWLAGLRKNRLGIFNNLENHFGLSTAPFLLESFVIPFHREL